MTYAEAVSEWIAANPGANRLPDHARSTLRDGCWHMASHDGIPLGQVDDTTGRYLKET